MGKQFRCKAIWQIAAVRVTPSRFGKSRYIATLESLFMKKREETLSLHKRPVETVTIQIPADTRQSLQQVAATKDMSEAALLKLYIGNGLRQDLSRLFSDRVLEMTQKVLSRHLQSEEEVRRIMQEIRGQEAA